MAITTNGGAGTALAVSADLSAAISDESGTGVVVFNTSPTLVTPTLGTASATAIELGHATDTTLARSSAGVITVEGVVIPTISSTSTLTNKTLTSPTVGGGITHSGSTSGTTVLQASAIASGTLTLPAATDTLVGKATTDTLTNKTLTSPALTTPTISTATTNGDLLYGTGSGALARLGIGATSTVLTVVAGVPSWVAASAGTTGNDQAFAFGVQVYS